MMAKLDEISVNKFNTLGLFWPDKVQGSARNEVDERGSHPDIITLFS